MMILTTFAYYKIVVTLTYPIGLIKTGKGIKIEPVLRCGFIHSTAPLYSSSTQKNFPIFVHPSPMRMAGFAPMTRKMIRIMGRFGVTLQTVSYII
jgi:hypothetical protein